ncbi:MAG: hypothetical protein ABSF77_06850 [Spirochaetia bacterium]|jgi:hypothetical protein
MKFYLIIVAYLLVARLSCGFAPSMPEGAADGAPFNAWVTNDALGFVPVNEWDDLRTTGFGLSLSLGESFEIQACYDILTWRDGATRIDAAGARVAIDGLDAKEGGFRFLLFPAAGVSIFGDLGGLLLQEGVHGKISVERPVPESYDSYRGAALAVSAVGRLSVEEWPAFVPETFGGIEGDLPGTWRAEAGARARVRGRGVDAAARISYRYQTEAGLSATLDAVSRGDRGVLVAVDFGVGHLTSSAEHNLSCGVSNGSIGIRWGAPRTAPGDRELAAALELSLDAGQLAPGRRVFVPIGDDRVRAFVGAAMGYWHAPTSSDNGCRFCDYCAGAEGRVVMPMGMFEAELGCALGPGFSVVTAQPIWAGSSEIVDSALLLSARIEPTVRLGLVERVDERGSAITGIGATLSLASPPWVMVPFISSRLIDRGPVALKVFAFSEMR